MKAFFASLLCLVLAASQSFALKGGPPYQTGGSIKGTYAGVMQGVFDPTNPRSSNTLGLFSFSIPESGFATGTVVIFVAGRAFIGTVQGIGDPNKGSLRAVVQSTIVTHLVLCKAPDFVSTTDPNFVPPVTPLPTDVTDRADGTVNASITSSAKAGSSVTGTLLKGTGFITATQTVKKGDNNPDCQITVTNSFLLSLLVDGFKQSTSTTTSG